MSTTASRPVRETPEYVEAMAKIRAARLRAAGVFMEVRIYNAAGRQSRFCIYMKKGIRRRNEYQLD